MICSTAVAVAPRWWPRGYTHASAPWSSAWPKPVAFSPTRKGRLSGLTIALDPGHDIGNGSHISAINKTYWVGLTKTCNTTGTATNAGYPEATYNFDVVARLRRLLVAQGATVVVSEAGEVISVTRDQPTNRELLRPEENALLFPGDRTEVAADAVRRLLADPALWTPLAATSSTKDVIELRAPRPVTGRYVLIWLTRLPPAADAGPGIYQGGIKGVTVSG